MQAYLVKSDVSSFGKGLRGPWRPDAGQALGEGEYYEEFVPGRILKAWYWDERLIALEGIDPPKVTGDGKSTVRALIERGLRKGTSQPPWEHYARCVAFHGAGLETVLEAGREVVADILYGSKLLPVQMHNTNRLEQEKDTPIGVQLAAWGPALLDSVPAELRGIGTMYTVDAMAAADGRIWLLEMNCNPTVHPDAYAGMFEGLFRTLPELVPAARLTRPAPGLELAMPPSALSRPWAIS
jgi:hypothetical protein